MNIFARNSRRTARFLSSVVAALLSGIIISISFVLITGAQITVLPFEGYGWVYYLVYGIFSIVLLFLFFHIGKKIMLDKKERDGFALNYWASIFASIFVSISIIFRNISFIIISIIGAVVLIAFLWVALKKKWIK